MTPAVSETLEDFPGSPVVRNLPRNEGDTGLIPGWGTKIPRAAGKLKPFCCREPLQHNEDSVQPKKGKKNTHTHTHTHKTPKHTIICNERI